MSVGSGVEVGGSVSLGAEVLVGVALAAPGAKARPERAINAMITAPISMNTAGVAIATGQGMLNVGPRPVMRADAARRVPPGVSSVPQTAQRAADSATRVPQLGQTRLV
ncbi:MAG: hypothetical protein A2W00_01035 [Candidatus Eisenbacteria bacterium RBG_16_71_46]|nr:MAG: hypothetical protein A2W00_01035 [Candidatus Eisenbacteria bacterium RBG_16_71_46]